MIRVLFLLALAASAFLGFGMGAGLLPSKFISKSGAKLISGIHPDLEFPLIENKSFTIVLVAQNDFDWCERSLRSIFEQDYEHFRLILVDDGSVDGTLERARHFITENAQEHRAIVMQNETPCGFGASLHRAASHCLDREIIVPLSARDWMVGPSVLSHWNRAFQNPDVWIAFGRSIGYPSYEFREPPCFDFKKIEKKGWSHLPFNSYKSHCFYSALLKQTSPPHLRSNYLLPVLELSGGRVKNVWESVCFVNETQPSCHSEPPTITESLEPLQALPL
jgi:hypothetical protein